MTPQQPPAPSISARDQRRQAKLVAQINRWWNSTPESDRRPYYGLREIAVVTGQPMQVLGSALRAMNWLNVQVRLDGMATAVWVPPGSPSPLRARGRPRAHQT